MTGVMRREVERKIIRRLIRDGLNDGYFISIHNGDEDIYPSHQSTKAVMEKMFDCDEQHLIFQKDGNTGYVWLVYGNDGYDVICDYSTGLEPIMGGAKLLSDYYSGD